MKILHLLYESKGDYFGVGGVATRAYEIYHHLRDKHDITLLCKKYPGAVEGEKEGLRHFFAGTESRSLTRTLLAYARQAYRWVRERGDEYDVIVEEFSPAIPTFLHAAAKKPVVLQVQGYTGRFYFKKYNPLYASVLFIMEQLRPACYRNFIFINGETAARFHLKAGSRIGIISNGVSSKLFGPPMMGGDYVLYLGRIDIYSKGLDLLLTAYTKFLQSFPETRLLVAGEGRDMNKFRGMIADLPEKAGKKVELLGWVSGERKIEVLQKAAFVVFPSRHEVQPISILESMACCKAVVVSDIPGFRFAVQNEAGLSFLPGDASSLALAMEAMMRQKDDQLKYGLRGREWAKEVSWDRIALLYEDFLYRTADMILPRDVQKHAGKVE